MGASQSGNSPSAVLKAVRDGNTNKVAEWIKTKKTNQNINWRDPNGNTLLHLCCLHSRKAELDLFIEAGADINFPDHNGNSPLHSSVYMNNVALVQTLIDNGADVNPQRAQDKATPLLCAVAEGDENLIELLIEQGNADINRTDAESRTALMVACMQGNESLVSYLVEHGADCSIRDLTNCTPYIKAKAEGYASIINIFEEHFSKLYKNHDCKDQDDEKCCKVCWERPTDTAILWCGHVAICMYCSLQLQLCPICCQPISRVQRVVLPTDLPTPQVCNETVQEDANQTVKGKRSTPRKKHKAARDRTPRRKEKRKGHRQSVPKKKAKNK
eukprot:TRINITY_DN535_c0_g1_i2.p1 TRINITY_DN535_c0_g1~~TRINITY_DN535_c0_g1_i2.p1  ORF type:complete len:329 (+),score=33.79 TRINITY_DN535_c0_g1_i2:141-1127(+)